MQRAAADAGAQFPIQLLGQQLQLGRGCDVDKGVERGLLASIAASTWSRRAATVSEPVRRAWSAPASVRDWPPKGATAGRLPGRSANGMRRGWGKVLSGVRKAGRQLRSTG